jgi:hypothetical protein
MDILFAATGESRAIFAVFAMFAMLPLLAGQGY